MEIKFRWYVRSTIYVFNCVNLVIVAWKIAETKRSYKASPELNVMNTN